MCLFTCTVLFFPLNTLLASLLSVFVRILSCKAKGPGPLSLTTGLVARISCCHHCEPASISGWEPKSQDQGYILSLHLAGEMLTDLPKVIRLRKNWVSMFLNMCFFLPLLIFKIFFWGRGAYHMACGILVPHPGIKPTAPAMEEWSLNWTAWEVTLPLLFLSKFTYFPTPHSLWDLGSLTRD